MATSGKTQGEATGRTTGGYYMNAAQAGEPPGRWWGPGAQALGLTPGQIVQRELYDAVYQQIDPRTGDRLGRPRGRYPTFAVHLARLKAAEPHATAERLIDLEREAAQATPARRAGCLDVPGTKEQAASLPGGGCRSQFHMVPR